MTTNIVPANIQVPAHLAARVGKPSALAESLTGGLSASAEYPRISIKASRFRIVDGDAETVLPQTTLDVVIVGANPRLSKTYYTKAWTPDAEPSNPDCFSLDGVRPNASSTDAQSDLCANCPQNAWGSRVTQQGTEVKACADQKRLAIVAADDPEGAIYLLQVTPAALKGLNKYQKELSMRGIPPEVVKTRVSFDTDASFPKLTFTFGGFLDEETQQIVDKLFGSPAVKEITGEAAPVQEPSPKVTPKPVVQEAPAPAPTPAAEAPTTVRRGFGGSKAAPAPVAQEEKPKGFGAGRKAKPAAVAAAAPVDAVKSLADEIADLLESTETEDA